ncbi:MAG: hypothetical protein AABX72_03015 [Nanoarchaeota archaeon]
MVKKQRKQIKKVLPKGKVIKKPLMKKLNKNIIPITTTITSTEGGCADSLTASMQVEKDKIIEFSIKPARHSCPEVKKVSEAISHHVIGKHIGDVYTIKEELFDAKAMPHHSSILVIHALRQLILQYESQKATGALREAMSLLQEYDKDLPERNLGTDYEY